MRASRLVGSVGIAATIALSLAACGSSSSSSSSSGSSAAADKPAVSVPMLKGTQTAVTLNMGTIAALKTLGVTVTPNGSATGITLPDGAAVKFPITGGHVDVYPKTVPHAYVEGEIDHKGSGLTLTVGAKSLEATDFVINPGTSMLSATIAGASTPLFFLDGSGLVISGTGPYMLDGTKVELLPSAASAIDKFFGVPDGTVPPNALIGIAHIVAS